MSGERAAVDGDAIGRNEAGEIGRAGGVDREAAGAQGRGVAQGDGAAVDGRPARIGIGGGEEQVAGATLSTLPKAAELVRLRSPMVPLKVVEVLLPPTTSSVAAGLAALPNTTLDVPAPLLANEPSDDAAPLNASTTVPAEDSSNRAGAQRTAGGRGQGAAGQRGAAAVAVASGEGHLGIGRIDDQGEASTARSIGDRPGHAAPPLPVPVRVKVVVEPPRAAPVTLPETVNRLAELLVQLWLAAGMTLLAEMLSGRRRAA